MQPSLQNAKLFRECREGESERDAKDEFGPRQKFQTHRSLQFEPRGPRYHVVNNHDRYFDWEFTFRQSPTSGLQLFDIRFRKEWVVHELSVQEVNSIYGGDTPGLMRAKSLDNHYGIGKSSNELVKDVDCPDSATFLHTLHLMETCVPPHFHHWSGPFFRMFVVILGLFTLEKGRFRERLTVN